MTKIVTIEDISKLVYTLRLNDSVAHFNEKVIDTVLEDLHILIEHDFNDLEITTPCLNDAFDKITNIMNELGYDASYNFFNTLRVLYPPKTKYDFEMNLENALSFTQKSVFAYTTKLRNIAKCQTTMTA